MAAVVIGVGLVTGAFVGTVKGYDGWGHLTKVLLVVRDFPQIDWNPYWYSGSPFFLGGYPPLFYLTAAAEVKLGVDPMAAMNLLAAFSYVVAVLSLYGLVRIVTGSRLAGAGAAGLLIGSPAFWIPYVVAGLYTRVFGFAFASLAVLLATLFLRRPAMLSYLLFVAATWAALSSHVVLGALAVVTTAVILALVPDRDGNARWARAFLLAPPLLLAAYYYLPLALYGAAGGQETAVYPPLDVASLAADLFPVLPATVLLVVVWRMTGSRAGGTAPSLALALGGVACAMLAYALLPLPRVAGLRSPDVVFFLCWFGAAVGGLALGSMRLPAQRWRARTAVVAVPVAVIVLVVAALPTIATSAVRNPARPQEVAAGWHSIADDGRLYRVASPSDNLSVWFNAVYDQPQTRGYAAIPQVLNPQWQYWLDTTAWSARTSEAQREFIFDWYAVRWIYVPAPYMPSTAGALPQLTSRPEVYSPIAPGNGGADLTFEYLHPTPIAVATDAPTFLYIGDPANYELFFRDLSYSGFDSRSAVTIDGGGYIDDFSAGDLARFDAVVLYGARAHTASRAADLLTTYVKSGGGLIVDGGGDAAVGVTASSSREVKGDWAFQAESSPVTDGIDFSAFGPPQYDGGPWTVAAAARLEPWAQPVLTSGGQPVVASGQLGAGRVVWSGLYLIFHVDSYRNAEESRFLAGAMAWVARRSPAEPTANARLDGPEQLTVEASSAAHGVLFKVSYFDRWHAYVDGAEATIYRAGPGFMYVMLPARGTGPITTTLRYERSPSDIAGIVASLATLVALLTWPRWRAAAARSARRLRLGWRSRWLEDPADV